ncbi:acetyl/propionyl/methylcrotonyl-CoA carboxylase subunit alpha [Panacagrimonas sp.]|uniref:acetyl/propionyl/methylcrotonyl-CoA carboxylase subunit alpha n=1 Tax=Panacagrimonas sp. TaxID=2480088 RepID=UPI003B519D1A
MRSAFNTVLIANRGEIAVRLIRGARKAGYRTVAVYSEADADSLHAQLADEAICIGPAPASESYLCIDSILEAARCCGAQAIHPGYGFLSERDAFAQAVIDAGLVFIGPDPAAIAAMGNKSASKRLMIAAGVPCVPGYQGQDQRDETLIREARGIGFPVMIKAAAGGGGRGMRLVESEAALPGAIAAARSESAHAFGSDELLIEKAVVGARHVEIQVFGDRHGTVVHLGERDCSVQRRHQKVVEESPSCAVDDALRARMGVAAVAAARAVNYVGAGTVEFLLAQDGAFYFLEMNTRLQVEHPVTEAVYGIDLVEWQLRIAQGEAIPLTQAQIASRRRGHAIEVRLCAEDPAASYAPQTGTVLRWSVPDAEGLRIDGALREGLVIGAHYDSLQAKLIAWGEDREQARTRLLAALGATCLLGVACNRDFLARILAHPAFATGEVSTDFIARHLAPDESDQVVPSSQHLALAAAVLYADDAAQLVAAHNLAPEWTAWRSAHPFPVGLRLEHRERVFDLALQVEPGARAFRVEYGDADAIVLDELDVAADGTVRYCSEGVRRQARYVRDGDRLWLDAQGRIEWYRDLTLVPTRGVAPGSDGRLLARSDGRILAVHVQTGERVDKGQALAVLEAMKMEFQLSLPVAGVVESVSVTAGQQVKARQLLIGVIPDPS